MVRRRALPALGVLPAVLLALLMLGGQPFAIAPVHAAAPAPTGAHLAPTSPAAGAGRLGATVRYGPVHLVSPSATGGLSLPGLPSVGAFPSTGVAGHAARPSAGSTASNWVVDNVTTPTSLVSVGGSNSTLLLASASYADIDNGSIALPAGDGLTPSPYFFKYGYSTIYRSTDSGTSWHLEWVPLNSSWIGTGGTYSGLIGTGVTQLAAGGTGGATGDKIFGVESVTATCVADGADAVSLANCTDSQNLSGPVNGVAITESTNGGQTWSAARPLIYADPQAWYVIPTIGSCKGSAGFLNIVSNETLDPQVAYSAGSNVVVVTWVNISSEVQDWQCTTNGLSAFANYTYTPWMTISTNGGATFSTPAPVGANVLIPYGYPLLSHLEAATATAIGPGPTYPVYRVWNDPANGSYSQTAPFIDSVPFEFSSSTNNGTSWSTPADIGNLAINPVLSAAPGSFANLTKPYLVVDDTAGSAYLGDLYLFWTDNATAGTAGTPSIAFSRSTDGGTIWSDPVYISANDAATNTRYFQPSASVGPNGAIWVQYYGESLSTSNNGAGLITGSYDTYGTYSTNGGSTWSAQFRIDDTTSSFQAAGTGFDLPGLYGPAIADTTNGAYAAWSDCRGGLSCPALSGLAFQQSAYVANLHTVGVSSNAPGVNATVTTFGPATTLSLPSSAILETGATFGVQVPAWVPDTTTMIYAFQNYSGFASSNSNPAALTYSGSGSLSANYLPEPAGWIAGTVGPVGPGLVVLVNGVSAPLTPYNSTADHFNATIAAGVSYVVMAGRPGYTTYSQLVPTQAGKVSAQTIWLPRESGWISGKLTPANATLTVNSSVVAVNPNGGAFNQTVTWGQYWVNASENGYTTFSQEVTVSPEKTSPINPTLVGGWITGSINPLSGAVQVNGVPVTLQGGNFNVTEPGGTYTLTARAPGYSWFHWSVLVTPGKAVNKNIHLTNQGYIVGTIGPASAIASAIVLVAGSQVRLNASGGYNASEGPGSHTVSASATGFNQSTTSVTVVAGNVSWANITLKPSNSGGPNCTVTNTCPPKTNGTSPSSNSNLLLYAGIGAAVVLVAIIAGVLLMRRRPPAQDSDTGGSPAAAYDESAESGGTPPST